MPNSGKPELGGRGSALPPLTLLRTRVQSLAAPGGGTGPGRIGRVAIGDLLKRAAARFPDRTAVTDGERRVTLTEIERDANRFANYLVARGLKPGEKISTICNNSVEFVTALFGIHHAGRVCEHVDNTLRAQADRRATLKKRGIDLIEKSA